jgi:hypothetical protein
MPLSKIAFNPGVDKEGTQYTTDSGWFDSDKIRFRKGRVEKIGGWEKYTADVIKGVCRSLMDWGSKDGTAFLGIGTNLKFYIESGGVVNDVTPIRATTTNAATFAATNGSSTITITDTSHGAETGDFVTFSGAATLGGNITAAVLNQEYQIETVLTANTYTILAVDTSGASVTANASDTGNGGGSVTAVYQINTGLNTYVGSTGWGVGPWSSGAWGSTTALSSSNQLRLYSQDAFADDLIFNPRAGGVFFWDKSSGVGTRAVSLGSLAGASNTPTAALQVMVSDIDRHVICFGANPIGGSDLDPLLVRWSDQENAVNWTPTATNSAGGQVLSVGTAIVGAVKTRQEILISTDNGLVSMRFVGAPFIFSFTPVAENVAFASPKSAVVAGDTMYFMDPGGFYIYRGAVQRLPCSVERYVFDNLNKDQIYKVFATTNPDYSEVTWYYPVGEGDTDITNYVSFNYVENVWAVGTLERGAYFNASLHQYPIAASNDVENVLTNYLFSHEIGYDADGAELVAYVESGDIGIGDGDSLMMINRVIPDFTLLGNQSNASIDIVFKGRDFPLDTPTTLSTATVTSSSRQEHVRARSRESIIRIESSGLGYGWSVGSLRLGIRTDGRR